MENLLDSNELADFLGCTIDDLRNWRRLPADHPGHLPSVLVDGRHRYDPDVVVAWLVRNPKRLAHAKFVFDERLALAHAAALRGFEPAPEPVTLADLWNSLLEPVIVESGDRMSTYPQQTTGENA